MKGARVGILLLLPMIEKLLSAFHFWVWSWFVCLLYRAFSILRYIPSILTFLRVFFFFLITRGCRILSKTFSISIEINFLFLQFVNVVYHINWFGYIEASLHPRNTSHWSWYMILFMCCWTQLINTLLNILASILSKIVVYFACVFVWLWCLGKVNITKWVESVPSLFFLEEFRKDWY